MLLTTLSIGGYYLQEMFKVLKSSMHELVEQKIYLWFGELLLPGVKEALWKWITSYHSYLLAITCEVNLLHVINI